MTEPERQAQRLLRDYRAGLAPPVGSKSAAWAALSAATAAPVPTPASGLLSSKLVSGVLLALALGGGALWAIRADGARTSARSASVPRPRITEAAHETTSPRGSLVDEARVPLEPPAPAPVVAPIEAFARVEPAAAREERRSSIEPAAVARPVPAAPLVDEHEAPEPVEAPDAVEPAEAIEPAPAATLAEEVRLLRAAEDALGRGEPTEALSRLDEHRERFPAGALARERDVRRVGALCRVGRRADALALAAEVGARHPTLTTRLERACPAE